jgi:hypothetical protein
MKKFGFTMIVIMLAVIGLAFYTIDIFYFSNDKTGVGSTKEIDVDNLNNSKNTVSNNSNKNESQIKIEYDLPKSGFVVIKIYNAAGNEMMSLVNKYEHSGYHFVSASVNDLPEGIYSYRIMAGDFNRTGDLLIE